jgi:hypothetical protein
MTHFQTSVMVFLLVIKIVPSLHSAPALVAHVIHYGALRRCNNVRPDASCEPVLVPEFIVQSLERSDRTAVALKDRRRFCHPHRSDKEAVATIIAFDEPANLPNRIDGGSMDAGQTSQKETHRHCSVDAFRDRWHDVYPW